MVRLEFRQRRGFRRSPCFRRLAAGEHLWPVTICRYSLMVRTPAISCAARGPRRVGVPGPAAHGRRVHKPRTGRQLSCRDYCGSKGSDFRAFRSTIISAAPRGPGGRPVCPAPGFRGRGPRSAPGNSPTASFRRQRGGPAGERGSRPRQDLAVDQMAEKLAARTLSALRGLNIAVPD